MMAYSEPRQLGMNTHLGSRRLYDGLQGAGEPGCAENPGMYEIDVSVAGSRLASNAINGR
jgi:hypothetical protein